MKPTAQPIDPTKRTEVKPERILTREEASLVLRIFLLLLLLPFLFELGRLVTKSNALTTSARSLMQRVLTWTLKEGSPQVHLGQEGWLFDQRELNWLLRSRDGTEPAQSAITDLAETLKKQNISLVLVAMPQRATLYPEKLHLRNYWDPVRSNGEKARLDALRKSGIDVLDATDALWKLRDRKQIYFRRDSHWTPDAMKQVALLTEKHLREKHATLFGSETPLITATAPSHLDAGDLTRKLDPRSPDALFGLEQADVLSIGGISMDEKSPVLLLGSDFMWIYDDETQGFGGDSSAGFVTQMGLLAQRPLDVEVWPLSDEKRLEGKKLVVLVLPMSQILP